jgi:hypothetical protein
MDSLPTELFLQIASYLPPSSAPSFRLVNKRFAAIFAAPLFAFIPFTPTRDLPQRLAHLTSPHLLSHIRGIDYFGARADTPPGVFAHIVGSLMRAGAPLTTLHAAGLMPQEFKSLDVFPADACARVRDVRLCMLSQRCVPVELTRRGLLEKYLRNIGVFVQRCEGLEVLVLMLSDEHRWVAAWQARFLVSLEWVVGRARRLRKLHLVFAWATEAELVRFLESGAERLEYLYLRCFQLRSKEEVEGWEEGAWRRIFKQLAKMQRLRECTVSEFMGGQGKWLVLNSVNGELDVLTSVSRYLGDEYEPRLGYRGR